MSYICPICEHDAVHYYAEGVGDDKIGCSLKGCYCTNYRVNGGWANPPQRGPQTGERRLSEFFSGRYQPLGVVVLTRYFSDSYWHFYVEGDPEKTELKARTAWSRMPMVPV